MGARLSRTSLVNLPRFPTPNIARVMGDSVPLRSRQIRPDSDGEGFIITKSNIFYDSMMGAKKKTRGKNLRSGDNVMLPQITQACVGGPLVPGRKGVPGVRCCACMVPSREKEEQMSEYKRQADK